MLKTSRTLISMYTENYDYRDIENWKKDIGIAVPVGVTVDGTWQKCYGFDSLLDVNFISVDIRKF